MGNGASIHEKCGGGAWWVKYCRSDWRSQRSKQLDEVLGLQRPPLRRGQSFASLDDVVKKLTQEPIPLLAESDDNNDLKAAIAKLNSGTILHTEKRAIERLLAQRYEDTLAITNALAGGGSDQSGAQLTTNRVSDVLRQVLMVLRQNNLPTELDRSGAEEPAEWRVRVQAQRRRVFLVVRSLVRLKREVKRLSTPIQELGWLLPVAAQERWAELKSLAAKYRLLEGALQDTEVAISQLLQLREGHDKMPSASFATASGRASPHRAPRSGPGRMNGGQGTGGRAVSESGAVNSRAKPRALLTADPPPPPVSGMRSGRCQNIVMDAAANSSSCGGSGGSCGEAPMVLRLASPGPSVGSRTPMSGRKGGAGGVDGTSSGGSVVSPGPGGVLVPSISTQRSSSGTVPVLAGMYNRRLSVSGGSVVTVAMSSGTIGSVASVGSGILAGALSVPVGAQTQVSTPGTAPPSSGTGPAATISPRLSQRESTPGRGSAPFIGGHLTLPGLMAGEGSPPPNSRRRVVPGPTGDQSASTSNTHHHFSVPFETEANNAASRSPHGSTLLSDQLPFPNPSPPLHRKPDIVFANSNGNGNGNGNGGQRVGRPVEPSPPTAPPPAAGARRPLGPLSSSSPGPLSAALLGSSDIPGTCRSVGIGASAPVAGEGIPPVLIQDGESLEQALARFRMMSDDIRNALVDTARQFRGVVDGCNSSWADKRWWLAAHTQDEATLDSWPVSDEYVVHRADVVRCLKAGAVAFQFMCATEEPIVGPTGTRFDLWTTDPWELAVDLAPDKVAESQSTAQHRASERIVGLPFGVRVLQQLSNSVVEVAGPLALESLPVILHISERQREVIASDLLEYGIYRRLRKNLFIVVQRSHPVMKYNAATNTFLPDVSQPGYTPGSGFSMLQLLWPGHALVMNDEGELERLQHSVMQELGDRNTEWLVSRTTQDLSLIQDDGPLDMRSMAHISYMWNTPHLRYSVVVEAASTYVKHRDMISQYGSVLLCRKPKVASMVVGRLDAAVRADRYGGSGGLRGAPQLPVVELEACELNSAHMQEELAQIAGGRATATSVGLGRYVFRFEVLSRLLTGPTVLRPKIMALVDVKALRTVSPVMRRRSSALVASSGGEEGSHAGWSAIFSPGGPLSSQPGGAMFPFPSPGGANEHQVAFAASAGLDTLLLRLHLAMSDLTMHHANKMVALKAHRMPIHVRGPQDVGKLVAVLTASDTDLHGAAERLAAKLPSFARQQKPAQNILVFVQDNSVSLTATNVAAGLLRRERGDRIHLVTVVPSEAQRGEGSNLMERLLRAFRTPADVVTHVMSQEGRGLLECVADVVRQQRCGLLVAGSTSITAVAAVAPRKAPLVLPGVSTAHGAKPVAGGPGTQSRVSGGATGSSGAAGGVSFDEGASEMLLSSVALSILRTFSLPLILVTVNTRTYLKRHGSDAAAISGRPARPAIGGVGGTNAARLAAMVVVERHSRPMMHHLAKCLLEPSLRQDALSLTQVLPPGMAPGNAGYDPSSIHCVALKTLMANFERIGAANDFHTPNKVYAQGEWHSAVCIAARDQGAQLLCVQLPPGSTKSLSAPLLQLIRSAPCPVLVFPEKADFPEATSISSDDSD